MDELIIWDTESTDLYATWGRLLCFTYITLRMKKPRIIRISDYPRYQVDRTDDSFLVKDIRKILSKAGAWFTWYGVRHDVPLVDSRLVHHGMKPLPHVGHIDGWRVAKYKLRLPSNRLETVSRFLGVAEKTPIRDEMWVRARSGYKDGLSYVYRHGLQDALVTKQVYKKLLPLIEKHPNIYRIGNTDNRHCRNCGGKHVQRDGFDYAEKTVYRRYECQECGKTWRGETVKPGEGK